jgi:hypothetical protein
MIKQDLETITKPHISNYMDSQPKQYDVQKLAQWAQKEKTQSITVKGLQQLESPTEEVNEEAAKEWNTVLQAPDTDVSTDQSFQRPRVSAYADSQRDRSTIIRVPGPGPGQLYSVGKPFNLITLNAKDECSITTIGDVEKVLVAERGKEVHVEKMVKVRIAPGMELIYLASK